MLDKKEYANGQAVYSLKKEYLTYYFENGIVKAEGAFRNDKMEDEWLFYRKTGDLWQVGQFKNNEKHGRWIRYNKEGEIEYDKTFDNGKIK